MDGFCWSAPLPSISLTSESPCWRKCLPSRQNEGLFASTVSLCSDILGEEWELFKIISALYGIRLVSVVFIKKRTCDTNTGGSPLRLRPNILLHSFNNCRVRRCSTITDMPSMIPRQVSSTTGGNTGMGSTWKERTVCWNLTDVCALWTMKWTGLRASTPL